MSCKICGRNSCTESFHSLEEQEKHENPEAYYEDIISKLETDKEALEAENKKLREGIASIIRDSKNDGSYLIVPIRKLLELNQAPTGGGDR